MKKLLFIGLMGGALAISSFSAVGGRGRSMGYVYCASATSCPKDCEITLGHTQPTDTKQDVWWNGHHWAITRPGLTQKACDDQFPHKGGTPVCVGRVKVGLHKNSSMIVWGVDGINYKRNCKHQVW